MSHNRRNAGSATEWWYLCFPLVGLCTHWRWTPAPTHARACPCWTGDFRWSRAARRSTGHVVSVCKNTKRRHYMVSQWVLKSYNNWIILSHSWLILHLILSINSGAKWSSYEGLFTRNEIQPVMVYSHWLGPEPGPGQGPGPGRMGCMVLIRTFHTVPEQAQGRTPGTFSGPEEWVWYPFFRSWKCSWWWILVFFPVPVQVQCERFLLNHTTHSSWSLCNVKGSA